MSLLDSIFDRLGLDRTRQASAPDNVADATPGSSAVTADDARAVPPTTPASAPADTSVTTLPRAATSAEGAARVDVASRLDARAAQASEPLAWRTSIVDLLKTLDLDSSLEARRDLAEDLGCPADELKDSARMNDWLHRQLMHRLAEHGGDVPDELLP